MNGYELVVIELGPDDVGYPILRPRYWFVMIRSDCARDDSRSYIHDKVSALSVGCSRTFHDFLTHPSNADQAERRKSCKCCVNPDIRCRVHCCYCDHCKKQDGQECAWKARHHEFIAKNHIDIEGTDKTPSWCKRKSVPYSTISSRNRLNIMARMVESSEDPDKPLGFP